MSYRAIVYLLLVIPSGCVVPTALPRRSAVVRTANSAPLRSAQARRRSSGDASDEYESFLDRGRAASQAAIVLINLPAQSRDDFAVDHWSIERFPPIDVDPVPDAELRPVDEAICKLLPPEFPNDPPHGPELTADEFQLSTVLQSQLIVPCENYACDLIERIGQDHLYFYSPASLTTLAAAFSVGALIANSDADAKLRDAMQENLLAEAAHEYREFVVEHKFLGEAFYLVPAYATVAYLGLGLGESPLAPRLGEWSERSLRGIMVGAPPLLAAQLLTGGSRPGETDHEGQWRPLADDNGVSGHTFIGAIPLLSAAKMTDRVGLKVLLVSASMLPGLSRITDDAHYPSQVMLGWTLAYVATTAVDCTNRQSNEFALAPWCNGDSIGIAATWQH